MSDGQYEQANYSLSTSSNSARNKNSIKGNYQGGDIPVRVRNKSEESIPDKIGKGDDAKNSVVWHVITYSLTIYSCIVAALLVIDVLNNGGQSALNIVKDSWAVFTPIITLSLGYMFGKKEDDSFKKDSSTDTRT
ncbi:TPA: hypothetical protein ACGD8A_000719 [Serratia marcescens]|uniref:Holin n=1 Tax=Serratia marcescens SM39 TaxID=1334564 RepID=A0AAT9F5J4_SERMA|nr:hypothetical protein [Serratia marcescens]BAO36724.1 hypothetical protein SM39_4810 [Serratia marcescens SM39]BCZ39068.1 hypothetical protein SMGES_03940 [Serratia marcescens]